ncbi:hypothetical protein DICVIV_09620 [Dictyocaulus viviparus]|uniref:glutamine--fructose-6-phosphate transaminase (isomerizing) n=1 Tax=Dictyocaulus viviparus TaxID=29172 RepID=A0A0D8XPQ2_DICVI|nr:hypothetical protein DICVIV_09620 [Dictyocaulus viviparus]
MKSKAKDFAQFIKVISLTMRLLKVFLIFFSPKNNVQDVNINKKVMVKLNVSVRSAVEMMRGDTLVPTGSILMCGIFAYLNYLTPKKRYEIINVLLQGLQRMEYRGYDSAGIAIDGGCDPDALHENIVLLRKAGKVSNLANSVEG